MGFALALLISVGVSAVAKPETVEVAPGVSLERRVYPAPANEAPFFNFAAPTEHQTAANERFVREVLARVPDRGKAAQMTTAAGWQALIGRNDFGTAGRRFNQAFLLDPMESSIYQGFGAIAASRFKDFVFANELFLIAARMKSPLKTLAADHGRVLLMANRPAEAKPLLEKAVRDDPDWAIPRANLAWAMFLTGQADQACRLIKEAKGRDLHAVERDVAMLQQRASCT
jgi:Flp pilus assembly protein TadD